MSEKGQHNKIPREERLAAQLRANLRRRKQAARKVKIAPQKDNPIDRQNPDKPLP